MYFSHPRERVTGQSGLQTLIVLADLGLSLIYWLEISLADVARHPGLLAARQQKGFPNMVWQAGRQVAPHEGACPIARGSFRLRFAPRF